MNKNALIKFLKEQVEDAKAKGATIHCGGEVPAGLVGAYYQPTLITDVKPEMRVVAEETFGPVLAVIPFVSEAEWEALQ